ncbi:cation efflux family protein family [Aspergillus fumigatus Z5]|nr:cation efflux family protein family [Aspergillus fumigatus Z5]
MASNLPIPRPPRTPTPPPDDPTSVTDGQPLRGFAATYDKDTLSPMADHFSQNGLNVEDGDRLSPTRSSFKLSPTDVSVQSGASDNGSAGPFNFQTTTMAKGPVMKSNIGQRRGHKYKHSSISHQIFLEPPPRAPLALPNSLPIPTLKECRSTVDVLSNFEVWKRSSIRHPFGLERAEVLAGFAMCVLLLFMGMDLISHNLQHFLESSDNHEPHHTHPHERVSVGSVDITAVLAISSTLISAIGLKNHARIGKAMRFAYIESLPSVLSNPSHFLTLSCSTLLLLLPLVSIKLYKWLDVLLSVTISISMCVLGVRLVKTLGSMLLMSYSGPGVSDVIKDIEADPSVFGIDDARFWQVHYGLCMANLKIRVSGSEENLVRLRERISSLIKNRLGGGYGTGGQKWEVSLQFTVDNS